MTRQIVYCAAAMVAFGAAAGAQAPSTGDRRGCQPACGEGGVQPLTPPVNPHLRAGAQVGYTFASRGAVDEVSDFFTPRVEVRTVELGRFRMPLIGNFGKVNFKEPIDAASKLRELVNSTGGIQVTLSPYVILGDSVKRPAVVYVNLGTKLNRQKDLSDTSKYVWANQFRTSLGIDLSFDIGSSLPISIILEGVYGYVGSEKMQKLVNRTDSYLASVEGTVIVPLPGVNNFSLIAQAVGVRGGSGMWRLGTLIYTPQKKE